MSNPTLVVRFDLEPSGPCPRTSGRLVDVVGARGRGWGKGDPVIERQRLKPKVKELEAAAMKAYSEWLAVSTKMDYLS